MIKEIILKQKSDRDRLLGLNYIPRNRLKESQKWVETDLIKVITGPRRAGKSVFSFMMLKDKPFAYLNFDDEGLQKIEDYDKILQGLLTVYGETKILFFDEIQNLPNWELFVNRLHRKGYNLLLTGSNAKLLSRELATSLTGRHIPIEILPFDFKEFLAAKKFDVDKDNLVLPEVKANLLRFLELYLSTGGYPETVVKDISSKDYLNVLFDSLLFKDVVKRHKIRFSQKIDDLGSYLMNNAAQELSYRKLTNILQFQSVSTLEKYLGYLIEAYLLFILNRYSHKAGERITAPKKAFVIDNGFISAKAVSVSPDNGKMMENLVFIELLKRGCIPNRDLFYYKTRNNREVDFLVKEGTKIKSLIQVAYQVNNQETKQREIKSLIEAGAELLCRELIIITWDYKGEEKINENTIQYIPIWEWLLQ